MAASEHQSGPSSSAGVVLAQKEMDLRRDLELIEKIQDKEERLRGLLAPLESHIIWAQKVLVWEHPYLSVALLLIVNILFWLATTWRIYCLIGIAGMIAVAVEMWISCIFTETAGDSQDPDIAEGWTEVCPRLMGVPEVSNYLARGWVHGLQWLDKAISFRTENKPKFFVSSIFFLSIFAIIGVYIPGIYISYFTVMSLLLWPALSYHNIVGRIQGYVNPIIERIEQKLHIKRRRTKKSGKRMKGKRKREAAAGEDDSDSDLNIDEFIPPADALILTTLTKAVEDPLAGDEDDDSASYTPSEFTPRHPSQEESHEHTDDELLSEDLSMLVHDVKEMPSIDDLDNTHSETQHLLPNIDADVDKLLNISDDEEDVDNGQQFLDPKMTQGLEESDKMTFVPSHFKEESDEDDEDKLTEGLSFSNMRDDGLDVEEKLESESKVLGVIGGLISQSHSSLVAAFKSPVLSQTVSSVMTGTLSGISAIRNTVASMSNQGTGSGAAGQVPLPDGGAAGATGGGSQASADNPSSDLQVLESEFEFLEQEELDLANANSNN